MNDIKKLNVFDKKYGNSYSLLNGSITEASKEYFFSMLEYEKNDIYEAYHGSPNNDFYDEYIYPDNDGASLYKVNSPFLFLGHTHYNMLKKLSNTQLINPGSIGQPRDYNEPSFAVVDTNSNKVEMVRFTYNKKELIYYINKYDVNNKYLNDILKRKKDD